MYGSVFGVLADGCVSLGGFVRTVIVSAYNKYCDSYYSSSFSPSFLGLQFEWYLSHLFFSFENPIIHLTILDL